MRFSILGLLGLVAFAAVGCAALRSPTELWRTCFYSVAVGSLIAALVPAALLTGRKRAFWIAFALVGWGYHLQFTWLVRGESTLLTTKLLDYLARRADSALVSYGSAPTPIIDSSDDPANPELIMPSEYMEPVQPVAPYNETRESFIGVGQSLITITFALLGGCLGLFCYSLRQRDDRTAPQAG